MTEEKKDEDEGDIGFADLFPGKKRKDREKNAKLCGIFAVVCLGVGVMAHFMRKGEDDGTTPDDSSATPDEPTPEPTPEPAPEGRLYEMNSSSLNLASLN